MIGIFDEINLFKAHDLLESISNLGVLNLGDYCNKTWSQLLLYEPNYIRVGSKTDKKICDDIKQYRITGSRCYMLYTYNLKYRTDEEWSLKASKYF